MNQMHAMYLPPFARYTRLNAAATAGVASINRGMNIRKQQSSSTDTSFAAMSSYKPTRKRSRRQDDDTRTPRSQDADEPSFPNPEDFTLRAMFSCAGKGELALVRFQEPNVQLHTLKSLMSSDPSLRYLVVDELTLAAKATEDVDEAIEVAEMQLNEAMKTLNEGMENLRATKKAWYATKAFLGHAKRVQNADALYPSQHTIQTVQAVCAKVDFIGTSPKKIAEMFNFHSISDIEEVPDRMTLIELLKIAQQKKMFENEEFKKNMKKHIENGIFHRGDRFPIKRILCRRTMSRETAVALCALYFDVSGCDEHPEGTKFQEQYNKERAGNGCPWTYDQDPPSPVPQSYSAYSAMSYSQGHGPSPWYPAVNGHFAPGQGGYYPWSAYGNMYQPSASPAPNATAMNSHFAHPPSGGYNNGQGGYNPPPPSSLAPPAPDAAAVNGHFAHPPSGGPNNGLGGSSSPSTNPPPTGSSVPNSAAGPPGSARPPSTWTPTYVPAFNIGSSTPIDKKSRRRSASKKPDADSDSMQT